MTNLGFGNALARPGDCRSFFWLTDHVLTAPRLRRMASTLAGCWPTYREAAWLSILSGRVKLWRFLMLTGSFLTLPNVASLNDSALFASHSLPNSVRISLAITRTWGERGISVEGRKLQKRNLNMPLKNSYKRIWGRVQFNFAFRYQFGFCNSQATRKILMEQNYKQDSGNFIKFLHLKFLHPCSRKHPLVSLWNFVRENHSQSV